MSKINLHPTYQSSIYYTSVSNLPAKLIKQIKNTEAEVECSSYTCGESSGFIRGELELNGKQYSFEVSLGSVDIKHADYEWSDEEYSYVDEEGRPVDADEYAEFMLNELMSYACEIENLDVYLTEMGE